MSRKLASEERSPEVEGLRARLAEAEATLDAIRTGGVDALVVSGPGGERTLTIEGATHPYDALLNAMSDGAALLTLDGVTLFCNRRLGEIAQAPIEDVRRSRFESLVDPTERSSLRELMQDGARANRAGEFTLVAHSGPGVPVWIALSSVPLGAYPGVTDGDEGASTVLMAIVTDLTERKEAATTRLELMGRVISAEDDERRRIAQELHDETGQSLTALLVGLRAIEALAVTDAVYAAALRLHEITAETMDNVGRLARGLHPSVLDNLGLAAAVRRYVKDYSESFHIAVDLEVEDVVSRDVAPLAQTTLYRILQEALTNVARHARARSVRVELKQKGATLELVVVDDGIGLDARAMPGDGSGLGLHGMRERVALLGGSIEFESTPGAGTLIRARIPPPGKGRGSVMPHRRPGASH